MEFSSVPQFLSVLSLAVGALALGLWVNARWSNRRRGDRPVLAVEDPTHDDDLMAIVDAVAEVYDDCTCSWNNGYARPGTSLAHNVRCPAYIFEGTLTTGRVGQYIPVDTWQPARPGDTPGELVPGEGEIEPQPTLGQERLYDAEGLVQYGLELVDRRCLDARRDFATDRICPACAKVFARVTA
jgi:hypothetical protein